MKFNRLVLVLASLACIVASIDARAQGCGPQNPNCIVTTMPLGDASNRAASDAFVQNAIAAIPPNTPGGSNGQVQYNNSGAFGGFTAGQDCTITPGTGVVNCTRLQNVPVTATGASTNDLWYFSGTGWLHNTLVSLINAVCGLSPSTCTTVFGYVYPAWYGITCDGVTDWATQLQAMITASAGKTIFIPPGPDCLTSASLPLPSNTAIVGGGREVSAIRATTANPLFTALNQSNISLSNFHCKGSDAAVSWTVSVYGCIKFQQNGSAVAAGQNYNIQNMKFSGFNASYWIYFDAVGSTQLLRNITFSNNYILTQAADIPTDPTPSNNTNYAFVVFSGSAGSGRVENTIVYNNRVEATGVCFGLTLFSNTYKSMISDNLILNPGNTNNAHCIDGTGTVFNSYGILIYDGNADGNPPTNFSVIGNTVILPVAAGIYLAGDGNPAHNTAIYNSSHSLVANNLVDGQSSTDELLPRGGISINALTDIHVIGNKLFNGYGGINAVDQRTGSLFIVANDCTTNVGGNGGLIHPFCIHLSSGANGSSNTSKIVAKDNYLDIPSTLTSVIRLESVTGRRFLDVEISGNSIRGSYNGLLAQNQFFSGLFTVAENKFSGANTNIMFSASGLTGTLSLMDNVFFNSTSGVSGITFATLPAALNGSRVYISDGLAGSGPCTGASTGSTAMRQNGAWKCF